MARKHGRCGAYLTHHWNHQIIRWPRLRQVKVALLYALYCLQHRRDWQSSEGMTEREMELRQKWHYLSHYQTEKRRRHNYARRALCKNSDV